MTNLALLATIALMVFIMWCAIDMTWKMHLILDMRRRDKALEWTKLSKHWEEDIEP